MKRKAFFSILVIVLLCASQLYAHNDSGQESIRKTAVDNGAVLGIALAVVASWSRNGSILWAILHGLFNWIYVIYFALTRDSNNKS